MNEEKKMVDLGNKNEAIEEAVLNEDETMLEENLSENDVNMPNLTVDSSISSMTKEELIKYINSNKTDDQQEENDPFKNMTEEQLLAYINGDLDLNSINETDNNKDNISAEEKTSEEQIESKDEQDIESPQETSEDLQESEEKIELGALNETDAINSKNQDDSYDNSTYDLVTQTNPSKPFSQMTKDELIDFINRNSNTFLDYYDNNPFTNMSEEDLINYINGGNAGFENALVENKKDDIPINVINEEKIVENKSINESVPQEQAISNINNEKMDIADNSDLPIEEVEDKNSTSELFDTHDYKIEYEEFKSEFIKNKIKKRKLKPNYELQEGINYEENREELIRIENSELTSNKYISTAFDKWLFENYKAYKYVGEAKKIESEYKAISKSNKYTSDDLYKLKVKFEEAFVPSMFYTSRNGIYAKKNNDYLIAEYNGDLVPYRYLKSNNIYYPLYNLVYADAINQINVMNQKLEDSQRVKDLYFNDYCYFNAKENVSGSEKLKKAYKKMAIISCVIGILLIIIGVLSMIPVIAQYIGDIIDLENLPITMFVSGGVMCLNIILYLIFMIPLKKRNKRLKKVRRSLLVFMQNENNIYNVKRTIAYAKVKSFNKDKLNSKVHKLANNDYDVIKSITSNQIETAKLTRENYSNTSRFVRWICRIYSVLATALFAGSFGVLANLLLVKFSIIADDSLNFVVTYLAALGVSTVLGCVFLITKKKPILSKGLYYLYNVVIIIAIILLQMFVLYTF